MRASKQGIPMRSLSLQTALLAALLMLVSGAQATNILELDYDDKLDQLVIVIAYRGSHPDHRFTLNWDECRDYGFNDAEHQITAGLTDSDPDDRAEKEFRRTLKVPLSSLECRPAKVTVRTSANFFRSVIVPARPARTSSPPSSDTEAD
jgi:hypothetical protein